MAARLVEHETRPPEPVVESNGKERKSDEANEVRRLGWRGGKGNPRFCRTLGA